MKKIIFLMAAMMCVSSTLYAQNDETTSDSKEIVSSVTDQEPSFPGGSDSLNIFQEQNLQYPEQDKNDHIEGTVNLTLSIDEDGTITDVKVESGVHPLLDEEAVRYAKLMPKWNPLIVDGKPTKTEVTFPVTFKL